MVKIRGSHSDFNGLRLCFQEPLWEHISKTQLNHSQGFATLGEY